MNTRTTILNNTNISKTYNFAYYKHVYSFLEDLNMEYKGFRKWYFKKVFNSILDGERQLIIKEYHNEIMGVAILKKNLFENKISTLRVNQKYRGLGVGTELMNRSLDLLNDEFPLITVSSNRLNEFNQLLKNFNFQLFEKYKSYYYKDIDEYSFNKPLVIEEETPIII